ncbi:hypothetical protein WG954_12615 [Lacibacter sp. H375]|uniref:hypothetical protein n=1 Tax=Lacibacter sp. H375 TaxID=3133424 RepID=UPI0030C0DD7E
MLKRPYTLAALATSYLVAYVVMLQLNILPNVTMIMFFLSPFLVLTLAYSILRYGHYNGKDLKDNEHWGYQDRSIDKT